MNWFVISFGVGMFALGLLVAVAFTPLIEQMYFMTH